MLKDYELDYKSDDGERMLKRYLVSIFDITLFSKLNSTDCILSDNPRKKRLRISSTADDDYDFDDDDDDEDNLKRISLLGFETYAVNTPQVIYNAFSVGYRHLDLAEKTTTTCIT